MNHETLEQAAKDKDFILIPNGGFCPWCKFEVIFCQCELCEDEDGP